MVCPFILQQVILRRAISTVLLGIGFVGASFMHCRPAQAVDRDTLTLLTTPLEPSLFESGAPAIPPDVVTPDRVSQTGLTPPSLWWTQDQFGNNLLSYWLAYPGTDGTPRRVDLLVDQEVWSTYNYVGRYAFINHFGTAAKTFGYNVRVFNLQGDLLGAQICQFGAVADASVANADAANPDTANPDIASSNTANNANSIASCSIFLNAYGRGAFSGSTNPFGALSPTGAGTGQY